MTKKVRKSRFSASQNPPQILPKRLRNRCSNKHAIFHRFSLQKFSVAKVPTSILYWFLQYKMALGRFSSSCFLHGFGVQNLRKTLEKRCPNPYKIDPKNVLFFNIDFFGFWPRFRRVLGLQDGAKSGTLLAAPAVLNPTAFYACINILLCML